MLTLSYQLPLLKGLSLLLTTFLRITLLLLFHRADQFEYVMYGKVYRIEGDETSTEAATRL